MGNAFDFFEQIYCINLKHRTDRWQSCLSQFNSLGISNRVNRKEGLVCIHPKLLKKENAQIGCTLSHYYILKEAQKNNYSNIMVLEDDFLFLKDKEYINEEINKSTSELPKDWDIFYFGAFFVKGYDYNPVENYSQNLIKAKTCFCTHAICYSNKAINKILKHLKLETELEVLNFNKEYQVIDWYYVREMQENSECFASKNLLCVQTEGYSDIEKRHFNYETKFEESYSQHVKKICNF